MFNDQNLSQELKEEILLKIKSEKKKWKKVDNVEEINFQFLSSTEAISVCLNYFFDSNKFFKIVKLTIPFIIKYVLETIAISKIETRFLEAPGNG